MYAIRAAVFIATENSRHHMPINKIAEELDIPFHFLTKILQTLSKNGILKSARGPHGGVRLGKAAEKITLLQIIHAIDGPDALEGCFLGLDHCTDLNPCPIHQYWKNEKERILKHLRQATLAGLADRH